MCSSELNSTEENEQTSKASLNLMTNVPPRLPTHLPQGLFTQPHGLLVQPMVLMTKNIQQSPSMNHLSRSTYKVVPQTLPGHTLIQQVLPSSTAPLTHMVSTSVTEPGVTVSVPPPGPLSSSNICVHPSIQPAVSHPYGLLSLGALHTLPSHTKYSQKLAPHTMVPYNAPSKTMTQLLPVSTHGVPSTVPSLPIPTTLPPHSPAVTTHSVGHVDANLLFQLSKPWSASTSTPATIASIKGVTVPSVHYTISELSAYHKKHALQQADDNSPIDLSAHRTDVPSKEKYPACGKLVEKVIESLYTQECAKISDINQNRVESKVKSNPTSPPLQAKHQTLPKIATTTLTAPQTTHVPHTIQPVHTTLNIPTATTISPHMTLGHIQETLIYNAVQDQSKTIVSKYEDGKKEYVKGTKVPWNIDTIKPSLQQNIVVSVS